MIVLQGDMYLAQLDPIKGSEQSGTRPVLIISGNSFNANGSLYIACPVTSKIKNYYGDAVLEPTIKNGLKETSEVLGFQIRTLSGERLVQKIGQISPDQVKKIVAGIEVLLRY
jgi:mRNA interferase MazF